MAHDEQQPMSGAFGDELARFQDRLAELRDLSDDALDPAVLLLELESAEEELRVADEEVHVQQEEIARLVTSRHAQRWLHQRLVAMLPAPVLVTDRFGMLQTANAAASALLRVRPDRLVAKPVFGFLRPADRPEIRRRLSEAVAVAEGFRAAVTVLPRNAEPVTMELFATCTGLPEAGAEAVEVTWVLLPAHAGGEAHGESLRERPLAQALGELTRLNVHEPDTATLLAEVARICEQAFPFPVSASITLGPPERPELQASSSQPAQAIDGAQMVSGEGPCQSAWEKETTVVTEDVRSDGRWPGLAARLQDVPVGAVVAVPVHLGGKLLGALNLYGEDGRLADEAVVADVELLGGSVAAILHEHDVKAELEALTKQMQDAMRSRAEIEQAKGILMAMYRCTPDQAFARLAKMSSDRNVKLREIAARIVERTEATEPDRTHS